MGLGMKCYSLCTEKAASALTFGTFSCLHLGCGIALSLIVGTLYTVFYSFNLSGHHGCHRAGVSYNYSLIT